jgi:membrane protein
MSALTGEAKQPRGWTRALARMVDWRIAVLLRKTFEAWWDDRCLSMGAAIAFYAIFSLAPVLLIAIATGGLLFSADAARHAVLTQFGGLIGTAGADAVDRILASASNIGSGIVGTLVGITTFLVTATSAFGELQSDLNAIWRTKRPAYSGWIAFLRARFMSLALVGAISFLLMISLTFDALASAASQYISLQGWAFAVSAVNLALSIVMSALLFSFIFKVLPSVRVSWRSVVPGAVLTAVLFVLGKFVIGFYLGRSNVTSSYGAAASVITLMLWVYYSAQILLFGAEFTKVYAEWRNPRRKPTRSQRPTQARAQPRTKPVSGD